MADFTSALPLVILWSADLHYKGHYTTHEMGWKSGFWCHVSFSLTSGYHLLSPFLLCFFTLSRFMVVKHPMKTNFKKTKFVFRRVGLLFCTFLSLAAVMSLLMWIQQVEVPLGFCSPFLDPTNTLTLVEVLTWTAVISQIFSALFIIVLHIMLIRAVQKSQEAVKHSTSKQTSNAPIIVQIIVLTGSNILCWIPSDVVYLVSFFLAHYPVTMVIWITVAVAPINSVLNPVVFIFTTARKLLNRPHKV